MNSTQLLRVLSRKKPHWPQITLGFILLVLTLPFPSPLLPGITSRITYLQPAFRPGSAFRELKLRSMGENGNVAGGEPGPEGTEVPITKRGLGTACCARRPWSVKAPGETEEQKAAEATGKQSKGDGEWLQTASYRDAILGKESTTGEGPANGSGWLWNLERQASWGFMPTSTMIILAQRTCHSYR